MGFDFVARFLRLEEACGSDLLAPGFPEEMVDDEPEQPGAEVVVEV